MDEVTIKLWALNALYGLAGQSLFRITADFADNTLRVQIIASSDAEEDELENFRCFTTELLSSFVDAFLEDEILLVNTPSESKTVPALPIRIFSVFGAG